MVGVSHHTKDGTPSRDIESVSVKPKEVGSAERRFRGVSEAPSSSESKGRASLDA